MESSNENRSDKCLRINSKMHKSSRLIFEKIEENGINFRIFSHQIMIHVMRRKQSKKGKGEQKRNLQGKKAMCFFSIRCGNYIEYVVYICTRSTQTYTQRSHKL